MTDGEQDTENATDGLNAEQRQVAEHRGSPLLVFAAAGTGKTQALTARIASLLEGGVAPEGVLALTFTRKAAAEVRARAAGRCGVEEGRLRNVGTFHSLCARLLRGAFGRPKPAVRATLPPPTFTILEQSQAEALLDGCLTDALAAAGVPASKDALSASGVMRAIDVWRNRGLEPDDAAIWADVAAAAKTKDPVVPVAAAAYGMYREACATRDACDFSDLILHACSALERDPVLLAALPFEHLLIDEFQDTNPAQMKMVRLLVGESGPMCSDSLMVVGDDYQAIHEWRGATVGNILEFTNEFAGAHVVCLTLNYRSVPHVLEAAGRVIRHNVKQRHKALLPTRAPADKDAVTVLRSRDAWHEARLVVQEAKRAARFGDLAVLYRINAQSQPIEEALRLAGVPYRVRGSLSFFDRAEVRDCMAYARLAVNARADADFERAVATPPRGVGHATIDRLREESERLGNVGLLAAARAAVASSSAVGKRGAALREFVDLFPLSVPEGNVEGPVEGPETPGECDVAGSAAGPALRDLVTRSGLLARWAGQATAEEGADRAANIGTLLDLADRVGGTLSAFVDSCATGDRPDDEEDDVGGLGRVTLMTLHASKGLEFPSVVMVGCCEGLLPYSRSLAEGRLEEERRLCYVGVTRARDRLVLSVPAAVSRFRGRPPERTPQSRFLSEMGLVLEGRRSPDVPDVPNSANARENSLSER
jgi:DNA helicase-2/ATP-dependent DNA helicase PcrA